MAGRSSARPKAIPARAPAALEPVPRAAAVEAYSGPVERIIGHEEIARLAYSYWEARGFSGGSPEEDWFRAEEELKKRAARAARTAAA